AAVAADDVEARSGPGIGPRWGAAQHQRGCVDRTFGHRSYGSLPGRVQHRRRTALTDEPPPTRGQGVQADSWRYGSQSGRTDPLATRIQMRSRGTEGGRRSFIPLSCSSSSSLRMLQGRQAATTLSQVWVPPLLRGTTWSMFSAGDPQYWHTCPSRANTARRLRATRAW